MRKTKIIFTVSNDLTYDRRMHRICTALSGEGYEVWLVGRRLRASIPFAVDAYHGVRLNCFFRTGFLFYALLNLRLFFFLIKTKYDMACACDLDTAMAVRLASRLKRKKTVLDAHEFFTEVPELEGRPFVKSVWEWVGKMTVSKFHARYTVGEELAEIMADKYKVPFGVIRNIEPSPANNKQVKGDREMPHILLYQGALNVGRGLDIMIRAMEKLPAWELWLAGEGDITDELQQLCAKLNLGKRVKFLGWVKPEELPALLSQTGLSINLRNKASLNDYYSLPNKFFDAIHAGLPSINMDYPEYRSVIRDFPCALLMAELSAKALVDAIQSFDEHPETWHQMRKACVEAAKVFCWENEKQKLIETYHQLAAGRD